MQKTDIPLLLLAVFIFLGCTESKKSGASKNPNAANGCNPKVATCPTPPAGTITPGPPQDETNLPVYLIKYSQADAINHLVEAYRKPDYAEDPITASSRFQNSRTFLETNLNKGFASEGLKPGRQLRVVILESDDPNAAADDFQRVIVNTMFFQKSDSRSMLAVACHELAHSALNHAIKRNSDMVASDKPVENSYLEQDNYMTKAYNSATQKYVHNAAEYLKVRANWDAVQPRVSIYYKTQESQADVVGAMICGQFGMSLKDFYQGQIGFLRSVDAGVPPYDPSMDPKNFKSGETFPISLTDAYSFLFPTDTHPTTSERDGQLLRLEKPITKFLAQSTFFADWQKNYAASGGGVSLSEEQPSYVNTVVSDSGRVIVYRRPHFPRH